MTEDYEEFPGRLLHQAALWDNAELLEDLLHGDELSHLDGRDAWGRTPLHAAATTESSRCLRILLQTGADLNVKSGPRVDGRTCLQVAAEHGAVENVKLLLSHGADLLIQDLHGLTALDIAEQANHTTCMQVLKEAADAKEMARQEVFCALQESCSRADANKVRGILRTLVPDTQIINAAPNGSNTLLFKACEEGYREIVKLLLDCGADGRIHPVTKYSPMYIACYYGRKDIADMLIKKFPKLVAVSTVERWLPIHACIINGHYTVLELLLKFSYPKEVMYKLRDKSNKWEYEFPFDINLRDVTGQSVLYLACYVGNQKLVDLLLKHRVVANRVKTKVELEAESNKQIDDANDNGNDQESSPSRHRIAGSIHSLMTKLNLVKDTTNSQNTISPLDLDLYCNSNTETCLHVAVKNKHHNIVSMLLAAGANPNLRMYLPDDDMSRMADDEYIFTGSTALVEACRNRDMGMIDLLLKNNARDDECKALFITAQAKEELIISKLLALKSYPDPEFKINKRAFDIKPNQQFSTGSSVSSGGVYSSLLPTVPAMINWHGQRCLTYIKDQWLVDAAVTQNPKLRLSPRNQAIALYAITRLDISNNAITELPERIFQLPSLRVLMASQNKIERLPLSLGHSLADGTVTLPRKGKRNQAILPISVLEEIHLKDNRLIFLPDGLFQLPALQHLDVSNNKLSSLPYKIWSAPKLRELNVSFNLLHSLPTRSDDYASDSGLSVDTSSEVSDEESICSAGDHPCEDPRDESCSIKKSSDSRGVLSLGKHGSVVTCCRNRDLVHHSLWSSTVRIQESFLGAEEEGNEVASLLQNLNLSHNNFSSVPVGLSCLATSLTRLNLSYNRLTEMASASVYPFGLKQLDLSHNYIGSWPSLPHSESMESIELSHSSISCYSLGEAAKSQRTPNRRSTLSLPLGRSRGSSSSSLSVYGLCVHRRHSRLEGLRTLILADNQLNRLSLHFDENEFQIISENDANDNPSSTPQVTKSKLRFPSLSLLDISNNKLRELPTNLHELSNLSVLNIAGNVDISELPAEMGLLSRLWNLNTRGCSLQEPLKSMIESKKYKTMDVIGYLKSILEDARVYARMKLMVVGVQGIGKTSLLEQLRSEGTGSYKKKPVEHWAKRMGNKNINTRTAKGTTLSTVGVDIGDWIYEKKIRGQSSYGPVTFRTWDFGGQKEYYATHQYFLSKRSLYLVVWNICDGEKGVDEILQWLVNIQARAPNSPVLILGTHYDLVKDKFPPSWSEELQQLIRERFINVIDADKLGLPRVLDTIEVSCKTRHNIKLLCNLIYDTVFSLKTPGSKERLLEQKIPASYLALEDVIYSLALERRLQNKDPVLTADKYQAMVTHEMSVRNHKPFRDTAELNQATTFLHENGVLLHYEDVTLKDLYFLDPQWLCDMLAHVLTIREINPFVKHGIMRLDDLKHVFKSSTCAPIDAKSYIVSLLNKFEVALTWDNRTLLIPSLLPSEEQMLASPASIDVKIPVRSRGWPMRSKKTASSTFSHKNVDDKKLSRTMTLPVTSESKVNDAQDSTPQIEVTHRFTPQAAIRRLHLMSYFPSGFWSRLLTRILADDNVVDIVRNYFVVPQEVVSDEDLVSVLGGQAQWKCWQTGIELLYAHTTLFRLREIGLTSLKGKPSSHDKQSYNDHSSLDYRAMKFLIKVEDVWTDIEVKSSAVLEVFLPNEAIVLRRVAGDNGSDLLGKGIQSVVLDPSPECVAKLLSLTVDHVDTLLEDWYPALGTRFVHTSEGKFLVTRLVACPACLESHGSNETITNHPNARLLPDNWGSFVEMNPLYCSMTGSMIAQAMKKPIPPPVAIERANSPQRRGSWESRGSASDGDSGVGPDSTSSSRNPSAEGRPDSSKSEEEIPDIGQMTPVVYAFMVEECILAAYAARCVSCPLHGLLLLAQITPDIVFLDLGDRYLVSPESIKQGKLLGRGGFGFVFEGTCRNQAAQTPFNVALKMLQPVDPGQYARQSAVAAYKAAQSKWERDPVQYACKAYCSARQEVNILLALNHPNIVPLIGVCPRPLSLVLELAPRGALDLSLKHYRRSGAHLHVLTLQAIILQIAKAVEYLHGQHIIYRDLKSENVLVWELPVPFSKHQLQRVDVRLADYGISRSALPTGTKGFGGTEGFMAPEMMRHNGEEEYTEKVDCFSFGMFIYELLTTHQPYEHCDNVKEHVLEGGRPALTLRETEYPVYMLDLMVTCWSQQPKYRPSASQMVAIASAPEFTHLLDIISLDQSMNIAGAIRIQSTTAKDDIEDEDGPFAEMWIGRSCSQLDILTLGDWAYSAHTSIEGLPDQITVMCQVNQHVWLGDTSSNIHCYRSEDKIWNFSYCLDPESPSTAVEAICALESLDKVAVALSNGRLFVCKADAMPSSPLMGEGSFILTELAGFTRDIFTLAKVFTNDRWTLWCGGSEGVMSVFTFRDDGMVVNQEATSHFLELETEVEQRNVKLLHSLEPSQHSQMTSLQTSLWSYIKPGCIVYHWDASSKRLLNKLDCSKLVPCSESLESISIEEHLLKSHCQVTSLAVCGAELFVGTSWGCVIVAEAESMRPITIFRPFESEVRAIVPLTNTKSVEDNSNNEETSMVATIGKGYRNLLKRYAHVPKSHNPDPSRSIFCLLWKSHVWINS